MNPSVLFVFILSILLGVLRAADLAFGTDAVTGLCVVGSVWWRYLALGIVVLAAVLVGRTQLPARKRCVAAGRWPVFWLLSVQYVFWPQRVHRSRWTQLPVWAALCGAFWNACAPRGSAPWAAAGSAPTSGKSPLAGCIWPWRAVCCSTGTCCCALWRTAPAGTA